MFHQVEGLVVDKNISFADLKGVIDQFLKAFLKQTCRCGLDPLIFPLPSHPPRWIFSAPTVAVKAVAFAAILAG